MDLVNLKMEMTDISQNAMIAASERELAMAAEIVTETENEETVAVTRLAERLTEIRN